MADDEPMVEPGTAAAVRAFNALQAEMDRRFASIERERDLTTKQLEELLKAERDHTDQATAQIAERLLGMDRATALLNETINRVPTDLQQAIANLNQVLDERFNSVAKQFEERDTRSERESRDNKVAVDAAFAAQKEAAAKQDESNAKAIDKSEAATTETINKLGELFTSSNKGLSDKIENSSESLSDKVDDLKSRLTAVESSAVALAQAGVERYQHSSLSGNWAGVVIAAVAILVGAYIAAHVGK